VRLLNEKKARLTSGLFCFCYFSSKGIHLKTGAAGSLIKGIQINAADFQRAFKFGQVSDYEVPTCALACF